MPWNPCEAKDREVGTDGFTEVAVHTIIIFYHVRIMISLAIELISESQDFPGAIFDTKTAAFAPLNIDMEISTRDFYFVYI